MTATLAQLVEVRSQLAEAILDYLTRLADKLDQTQWSRGGVWIKASEIAVEQFVLTTRKRLRSARFGEEREERDAFIEKRSPMDEIDADEEREERYAFIEKRSPMDEIDAERYELPTNIEAREEERWRRVIQGGRVRLGLRGAPGSGKTFTTRETMARLARETAAKVDAQQISLEQVEAFIWITATALAKASGSAIADAVLDAMESTLQLSLAQHLREWLQQAIHSSRAFIVVDALDELGTEDVMSFTARSQQLNDLPARLIVTCRTMQWETRKGWLGWPMVTEVELSPFKPRQQREFADKFFQGATDLATSMQRLLQVNYSLRHACTTPLLLTFACWLHERGLVNDGTSYAELYGQMVREMVAGNWRNVRPMRSASTARVENCLLFLDEVAWRLFANAPEQNFFTLPAWYQACQSVRQTGLVAPTDEITLLEQLEMVGILVPANVERSHQGWSFAHRTFLEFLTARALSRLKPPDWLAIVQPHFWFAPEWSEVMVLMAGLVVDATPLVKAVEAEEDDFYGSMLYLRAKLIGAAKKVDMQVAKQVCGEVYAFWHEMLQDWSTCLRDFAAPKWMALAVVSEEAKENSIRLLLKLTWDNHAAIEALGKIGAPEAVHRLLELTADPDSFAGRAAIKALGEVGAPEAVHRLLELTADPDSLVRTAAIEALEKVGTPEAVHRLLELTGGPDILVRTAAIKALGEIGAPEAVHRLLELTADPDSLAGGAAIKALGEIGAPEAVHRLLELTADPDSLAGGAAIEDGLQRIFPQSLRNSLVRSAVIEALGKIGAPEAVHRLLELTGGADILVRKAAIEALGKIGAPEAVHRLLELSWDNNIDVRDAAIESLEKVGTPEAVHRLLELTREGTDFWRTHLAGALWAPAWKLKRKIRRETP